MDVIGYGFDRASCGFLDVQETPQGRDLSLPVSIIAPLSPASEPKAPVIFAHGGPGGQIVKSTRQFAQHPMGRDRAIILFDQRASGRALPDDCPDAGREYLAMLAEDLSPEQATLAQAAIEGACRDDIIAQGADLNGYGTRRTVADMETLREALGIDQWNVMGVSYGTTVALDYVRQHPDRTRALVLDSLYPPSFPPGGDTATRSYVRALEQLYTDCRRDVACRRAFPGLETSHLATLIALEREPLVLPADTGLIASGKFAMNPQDFTNVIHQMLYADETISLVPVVIDLAARKKANALANLIDVMGPRALDLDFTARLSVECRERWLTPGRTLRDMNRLERFLRRTMTVFDTEDLLCPDWAPQFEDAGFNDPVSSPVPALFYSGANDPITPPENTVSSFRLFPNAQYVHALHTGHGVDRAHGCIQDITAAFLDNPRELVRDGCVASIAPIAFVTDVALSRGVLPYATNVLQTRSLLTIAALGLGVLAMFVGLVWSLTSLARRRHSRLPSAAAFGSAALLGAGAVTLMVFVAVLTLAIADVAAGMTPAILALGLPQAHGWLLMLPLTAVALCGAGLLALVLAVARGGPNTRANIPLFTLASGCALALGTVWMLGFFAPVA